MTDQNHAAQALRKMVEDYEALYNRTPVMMHSIDREGRLISVSDRWLRVLGYSRTEVIGHASVEFLTAESRQRATDEVLPDFFRTGACEDVPYEFIRKDGEIVHVLLSATCERDQDGEVFRSLAVMVDVTARREAEAALRHAEEELRQAQKMEAIGRLAGGIAHDFNNLLVAILGHSDMLSDALPDASAAELHDHIGAIRTAGERAAGLTRQILGFTRKQPPSTDVTDFNHVVADTERMLQRILREDIELVTQLAPSPARVRADPAQLSQVLLNLSTNASAAMPSGGRLTIRTKLVEHAAGDAPQLPEGRYVLLVVEDTGTGMDAETLAHAFEPFFTTKERGSGTGLGLSTVYGIVKQNGGAIAVDSTPGSGTRFRIHWPCVEEATTVEPVRRTPLPSGSGTILVVEDSAPVRQLLEAMLREAGYEPIVVETPDEGIALARSRPEPVALVLTDVVLPKMHGPELVDRILELHPETRVLFMSGYTSEAFDALEGRDFLAKPFTREKLLRKLAEILARPTAT